MKPFCATWAMVLLGSVMAGSAFPAHLPLYSVETNRVQARADVKCPEDDSRAYFTGRTRTNDAGRLMKEYKCYQYGHLFWIRSK